MAVALGGRAFYARHQRPPCRHSVDVVTVVPGSDSRVLAAEVWSLGSQELASDVQVLRMADVERNRLAPTHWFPISGRGASTFARKLLRQALGQLPFVCALFAGLFQGAAAHIVSAETLLV